MSDYENENTGAEAPEQLSSPQQNFGDNSQGDKSSHPEMLESNQFPDSAGQPGGDLSKEDSKAPGDETVKQKMSEGFELAPDQNGIFQNEMERPMGDLNEDILDAMDSDYIYTELFRALDVESKNWIEKDDLNLAAKSMGWKEDQGKLPMRANTVLQCTN